jgi:hypothetical protein
MMSGLRAGETDSIQVFRGRIMIPSFLFGISPFLRPDRTWHPRRRRRQQHFFAVAYARLTTPVEQTEARKIASFLPSS